MEGHHEKAPTFLEIGPKHGRSPAKTQDLPGNQPLAWKVTMKKRRPSLKSASSMEGHHEKGRTFLEISPQHGRSP